MGNNNKVAVYDELVTDEMLADVLDLIKSKGFRYGWKSNKNMAFSHWNLGFSQKGISSENREDITSELPGAVRRLWQQIQPIAMQKHHVLLRAYANAHTYGTEGYIHRDSDVEGDLTGIIYLNQSWKGNWAGETVLFDQGEIVKAVIPKWKRLFVFPSHMKHAARGVSRFCPEARTVIVFKASKLEM